MFNSEQKTDIFNDRIIKPQEVCNLLGKSKRTIWRWYAKENLMPKPIIVQGAAVGWRESVLKKWLAEKENNNESNL